ncbi:MAG TPA: IS4 family transposase, partial [Chloroflexota bacterium]|nr:IS4 family transposase [Chloroflexota bacterium]
MASVATSIARIKRDALGALDAGVVERVCAEFGYVWRERELDPATTVALFVQQVLHGNVACSEVRHLAGADKSFTPSAYCQARARLPLVVVQSLLTRVCDAATIATRQPGHLWLGRHRVFHVDGSSFSMPDTPQLRQAFGVSRGAVPGCGFPTAHLLVLFHAQTGLLLDAWASPLRTGDVSQLAEVHTHLDAGDILIGDEAFSSYGHLAMLSRSGLHGLFPLHRKRVVDFTKGRPHSLARCGRERVPGTPRSRWIKSLGREDQLVEYFKPQELPPWMSRQEYDALPDSIVVRELRRTVRRPGLGSVTLTMVTTLLDPMAYPAEQLLELRLRRWDVETNLRHLKVTMNMDVLRCKSERGVRKELAVFCLVYNLVRLVMLEAARRQAVPVARVSFADALKWTRHARPGDTLAELIVNPRRPDRAEPRCKKRRPKQFNLMNKPRDMLRKMLLNQRKDR